MCCVFVVYLLVLFVLVFHFGVSMPVVVLFCVFVCDSMLVGFVFACFCLLFPRWFVGWLLLCVLFFMLFLLVLFVCVAVVVCIVVGLCVGCVLFVVFNCWLC